MKDTKLQTALDTYAEHLKNSYRTWSPNSPAEIGVDFEEGQKYIRVVVSSYNSRSAHSFVEKSTGLIWKSASWKAPTKNFSRGNVYDPTTYQTVRWNGV